MPNIEQPQTFPELHQALAEIIRDQTENKRVLERLDGLWDTVADWQIPEDEKGIALELIDAIGESADF